MVQGGLKKFRGGLSPPWHPTSRAYVSVVVTIEQQTIFRSDLLFLFNNLNIFLMNSNSFIRFQVRVQKKHFFGFEFKFGKMIEFFRVRVQVRVRSPVVDYL